jgi:hypothetical protein
MQFFAKWLSCALLFADGRLESANPQAREGADGKKVIPKLANTFEVGQKKVNPNRYDPAAPTSLVQQKCLVRYLAQGVLLGAAT